MPMRTRMGPSGGHWCAATRRWASAAAATASAAEANTAKKASPSVRTSTPPWSRMAPRRMPWCSARTPGHRSPRVRASLVDPSMSVNTNVTVPVGSSVMQCSSSGIVTSLDAPFLRGLPPGEGQSLFPGHGPPLFPGGPHLLLGKVPPCSLPRIVQQQGLRRGLAPDLPLQRLREAGQPHGPLRPALGVLQEYQVVEAERHPRSVSHLLGLAEGHQELL